MRNLHSLMVYSALMIAGAAACERESSAGLVKLTETDSATHYSTRPVVQFLDSNFTRAKLRAAWAKMYDKQGEIILGGGVTVEFYSKPYGALASVLTADSARIDDKTKDMTASGNVVVVAQHSLTTVKTSVMHWDSSRQVLHSPAFVDIASPTELLQGYGFESDPNLQHYTIYKVTGQTLLSPTGEPIISSTNASAPLLPPTAQNIQNTVSTTSTKRALR